MTVIEYVTEEVERQGHDTATLDGIERVGWMLDAWSYAVRQSTAICSDPAHNRPTIKDLIAIGKMVEREKNKGGIRKVKVWVGGRPCPPPNEVESLLFNLFAKRYEMKPLEFYRELLTIHGFFDGNGRSGKVILNWMNGTLLSNPIFPPDDFWGRPIRNP